MNEPNEYPGLRHSLRLYLFRTLLRLTRLAYEPYPIAVIVRRTTHDRELCDGPTQQIQNGRSALTTQDDLAALLERYWKVGCGCRDNCIDLCDLCKETAIALRNPGASLLS